MKFVFIKNIFTAKPKIFIFQACQGNEADSGITMIEQHTIDGPGCRYDIPVRADFLTIYATSKGMYFLISKWSYN